MASKKANQERAYNTAKIALRQIEQTLDGISYEMLTTAEQHIQRIVKDTISVCRDLDTNKKDFS